MPDGASQNALHSGPERTELSLIVAGTWIPNDGVAATFPMSVLHTHTPPQPTATQSLLRARAFKQTLPVSAQPCVRASL